MDDSIVLSHPGADYCPDRSPFRPETQSHKRTVERKGEPTADLNRLGNNNMNTTPVVTSAIDSLNAAKQKDAEREAGLLIGYIIAEQATIARYEADIKVHREELDKVAHDVINVETVTGHAAPSTPNVSEITIGKTIAKLNEDKQKGVEVVAQRLSAAITDKQASVKACQTRIAELQKKLSEIQPTVVTPTQVMGS